MIPEHLSCQRLVEMTTDWLEGALDKGQRVEFELHLVTCAGCAAYVEQLQTTRIVLQTLADDPPADDIRQHLVELFRRSNTQHRETPATGQD
jgi:anti-sigma factor RsiW